MEFVNPYLTTKAHFELLERYVLIHGHIYYDLNENIVSDHRYDQNCMQLYKMIEQDPATFKETRYYYAMYDFDGSTGFGLFDRLKEYDRILLERNALMLLEMNKEWERKRNGRKKSN